MLRRGKEKKKNMIKTIVIFLVIAVLGLTSVLGLKCHVCKSARNPNCLKIAEHNIDFLEECSSNVTHCATRIETTDLLIRRCADLTWKCDPTKFNCGTCNTNGCNNSNKVEEKKKTDTSKLPNPNFYLLKANSLFIGAIVFLLTLTIVWCSIRFCCKRKSHAYTEDEYKYDEDSVEYYEKEV